VSMSDENSFVMIFMYSFRALFRSSSARRSYSLTFLKSEYSWTMACLKDTMLRFVDDESSIRSCVMSFGIFMFFINMSWDASSA